MSTRQKDLSFTGKARRCYEQWLEDVQCYENRPQYPAFANLFLYNALNLNDVLGRSFDDNDEHGGATTGIRTERIRRSASTTRRPTSWRPASSATPTTTGSTGRRASSSASSRRTSSSPATA